MLKKYFAHKFFPSSFNDIMTQLQEFTYLYWWINWWNWLGSCPNAMACVTIYLHCNSNQGDFCQFSYMHVGAKEPSPYILSLKLTCLTLERFNWWLRGFLVGNVLHQLRALRSQLQVGGSAKVHLDTCSVCLFARLHICEGECVSCCVSHIVDAHKTTYPPTEAQKPKTFPDKCFRTKDPFL